METGVTQLEGKGCHGHRKSIQTAQMFPEWPVAGAVVDSSTPRRELSREARVLVGMRDICLS
jgi:hypothetical protein